MSKHTFINLCLFFSYLLLIIYSVGLVYIISDYREGILSKESGIFRHIFIIGVVFSIIGVSTLPFTSREVNLKNEISKWMTIANGWEETAYKYKNINYQSDWVSQIDNYIQNISSLPNYNKNHGIIYLVQRQDGIYKIGKADNLKKRLVQLREDYNQEFIPIRAWYVEDCSKYEHYALQITEGCKHIEGNRKELRKFTSTEFSLFIIAFDRVVKYGE